MFGDFSKQTYNRLKIFHYSKPCLHKSKDHVNFDKIKLDVCMQQEVIYSNLNIYFYNKSCYYNLTNFVIIKTFSAFITHVYFIYKYILFLNKLDNNNKHLKCIHSSRCF